MEITTKKLKLSQIKPNPTNPRKIGKVEMERLVKSLQDFPEMLELREIIIDENNIILGGNMRYRALKQIGEKECVAKIVTGLTPEQKREFIIKDNSAFGEWDMDLLSSSWSDLPLVDWGVDLPEDWLVEEKTEPADAEPQIDRAAELNKVWRVKTGDLWQIGDHRLLCGDSTKKEDVGRVMGGEKARLCFTSPMYGNARDYNSGKFDYMEIYKKFSEIAFSLCDDVLINLGLLHKEGRVFRYWDEWLNYCESNGNDLFGWYVWDQGSGMPGDYHGRLARCHEWIFHFSKSHNSANKFVKTTGESKKRGASGLRFRQKDGSLKAVGSPDTIGQDYKIPDSVVRIRREMARGIHTEAHPAVFPVEFPSFGIQTWSKENEIIYEPFCGSGTTMVACQNLNRKCRGIEISPDYCAVILQRMTDAFPGIEIRRIDK